MLNTAPYAVSIIYSLPVCLFVDQPRSLTHTLFSLDRQCCQAYYQTLHIGNSRLSSSVSENLAFSLAHLQDLIATDRQATKVGWCAKNQKMTQRTHNFTLHRTSCEDERSEKKSKQVFYRHTLLSTTITPVRCISLKPSQSKTTGATTSMHLSIFLKRVTSQKKSLRCAD